MFSTFFLFSSPITPVLVGGLISSCEDHSFTPSNAFLSSKHCRLLRLPLALSQLCEIQIWPRRFYTLSPSLALRAYRIKPRHLSVADEAFHQHLTSDVQCTDPVAAVSSTPTHTFIHDFAPACPSQLARKYPLHFLRCISTCLFCKIWLQRHLSQELAPVLPQSLWVLTYHTHTTVIYLCVCLLPWTVSSSRAMAMSYSLQHPLHLAQSLYFNIIYKSSKCWSNIHHRAHVTLLFLECRH